MYEYDEAYQFIVKRLKQPGSEKAFLNPIYSNVFEWSQETRSWVNELLHYSPEKVPLNPVVREEIDFGTYVRKLVYFQSAEDCKVSAYLLIPKGLTQPAPAIVALHCHGAKFYYGKEKLVDHAEPLPGLDEFKYMTYGDRAYASELCKRGYVVAIIDALGWSERGWTRDSWLRKDIDKLHDLKRGSEGYIREYDKIWKANYSKMVETIFYSGITYNGLLVWDDRRTIDLLCSLPEVDSQRIGCIGLSMGGYRSIWLASMDERIRCCCSVGYMMRFADTFPVRQTDIWSVVPGLFGKLPYPDLASLIIPRDLMVLYCQNDHLFDLSSMEKAVDTIERSYQKAGYVSKFISKGFPVGHQFSKEMQEYAFKWLNDKLKEDLR